jgi:hypothetical protein
MDAAIWPRTQCRRWLVAGAVVVAVDASYFVSGYDPSVLGIRGYSAFWEPMVYFA